MHYSFAYSVTLPTIRLIRSLDLLMSLMMSLKAKNMFKNVAVIANSVLDSYSAQLSTTFLP